MTTEAPERRTPRWELAVTGLFALPLLLAYPPLLLTGRDVRPASDDWCLLPLGRHHGFGGVLWDIYDHQNGRFFNAVVDAVVFSTYGVSSKVGPGVVLLGLMGLTAWVVALVLGRGLGAERRAAAVGGAGVGAAVILTMLLGKPTQYQTLYHAPTIITHTLTVLLALATGIATYLGQRRGTWHAVVAAAVGGVVLGTFNEAFTAVCLVTLAVLLLVRLLGVRLAVGVPALLAAGTGLVVGFGSVLLSPGSASRQGYIRNTSFTDPSLYTDTWHNWLHVVRYSTAAPSFALLVVMGLVAGALLVRRTPTGTRLAVLGLSLPALWAVTASLAACFVLTYSFNRQLTLRERTWPSMTITLLLLTAWLALLAGRGVAVAVSRLPGPRAELALGLLVVAAMVFGVRGLSAAHVERAVQHRTAVRAAAFDAAQKAIAREREAGVSPILVRPLPIDGLYEPFKPNKGATGWPQLCLPGFYGAGVYAAGQP